MMENKNEPGDQTPETTPGKPEALPVFPAETAAIPVPVPEDDPARVMKSKSDYSNSLHALLQKNKPDFPGPAGTSKDNPDAKKL